MYRVSPHLPVDELDPGTNLLVRGPPISGKYRLIRALLTQGFDHGDAGLLVSTTDGVDRVRAGFAPDTPLGVVDCVTAQSGGQPAREPDTWGVASPGDLTGIGIGVRDLGDRTSVGALRFALDSISTLLAYTTARQLYRFLHTLTSYVDSRNALGLYVAHSGGIDDDTLARFTSLFDGIIETRTGDNGPELRLLDTTAPTDWVPIPTDRSLAGGDTDR